MRAGFNFILLLLIRNYEQKVYKWAVIILIKMQNKFSETIHSIPELTADPGIMEHITKSLRNLFEYLGFEGQHAKTVLEKTLAAFDEEVLKSNSRQRGTETEYDLPENLLKFYDEIGFRERRKKRIKGRARAMYCLTKPHLVEGETTLDIGTGNSSIALEIHNSGYNVGTMDITDNRSAAAKEKEQEGLEFQLHTADEPLRYAKDSCDNSLLIAILHHCDDPIKILSEAVRVSRKRICIYESTFGVAEKDVPPEVVAAKPEKPQSATIPGSSGSDTAWNMKSACAWNPGRISSCSDWRK